MTDAPLDPPTRHTVLRSFAGHLDAGPDEVFAGLAALLRPGPQDGSRYLADSAGRRVVVQGDWWYRGEYQVRPDGEASIVEYEILNVAQFAHWAGAWTARSVLRDAPGAFGRMLTRLQTDLDDGEHPAS